MKIAVLVKQVPDTASVIKIEADGKSVQTRGLKFVLNPYDEIAVEQAIKCREAAGGEVIAVSAGGPETEEGLRLALAMGADSAVWIKGLPAARLSSRGIAKTLAAALRTVSPDLVLAGKQAVDDDEAQVAERVAEILGWPHVSVVTTMALVDGGAVVKREVEGGSYEIRVSFPAVLTAQKGLNTPRYPSLPNIMKAKKKEIKALDPAALGLDPSALASRIRVEALFAPTQQRKNQLLKGDGAQQASALAQILHEQEKVI
jgi:electron transfer flavoprotein beta subunit